MPFNEPIAPRTFDGGCAIPNIEVFSKCDKIFVHKFAIFFRLSNIATKCLKTFSSITFLDQTTHEALHFFYKKTIFFLPQPQFSEHDARN